MKKFLTITDDGQINETGISGAFSTGEGIVKIDKEKKMIDPTVKFEAG